MSGSRRAHQDVERSEDCSTPGGVFVGFTTEVVTVTGVAVTLLNARGRLCRVHQKKKRLLLPKIDCSTPGGVFVGFTPRSKPGPFDPESAQRPGASLSGSRRR